MVCWQGGHCTTDQRVRAELRSPNPLAIRDYPPGAWDSPSLPCESQRRESAASEEQHRDAHHRPGTRAEDAAVRWRHRSRCSRAPSQLVDRPGLLPRQVMHGIIIGNREREPRQVRQPPNLGCADSARGGGPSFLSAMHAAF